jgi:hypothetical protein
MYAAVPVLVASYACGLDASGLDPSGLDPSGLDPSGLDPSGLDALGLGGISRRKEPQRGGCEGSPS